MQQSTQGGLNILTLDEIFSDLDYNGIENIMETLSNLGVPSIFVTQLEVNLTDHQILNVVKENGTSYLK
jgi:DNA repair exonuclease SbcCD ATPase subunit